MAKPSDDQNARGGGLRHGERALNAQLQTDRKDGNGEEAEQGEQHHQNDRVPVGLALMVEEL